MTDIQHYRSLERMYQAAPINSFYPPRMTVSKGEAVIEIDLKPEYHHTAGAVHGSVYFKLLDDSAFFAANSLERDVFVLTTSFTTYITRPVVEGTMRAVGTVVNSNRSQWIAESVLYNSEGQEIARGNGIFVRSKIRLATIPEYTGDALGVKQEKPVPCQPPRSHQTGMTTRVCHQNPCPRAEPVSECDRSEA